MIKTNDGVKPTSQTYKDNYDEIFKKKKSKEQRALDYNKKHNIKTIEIRSIKDIADLHKTIIKSLSSSKECDKTNTQRENNQRDSNG